MSSPPSATLAILDDYAATAPRHFHHLPNLTLHPYPHTLNPATPAGLDALDQRLEPYEIISTMRERTPFPAALLTRLPRLKLLLTTGMRNAALDLPCAAARGVVVTGTRGAPPTDLAQLAALPAPPSLPAAGHSPVVQHAWAGLLALCGRVAADDRALKTSPHAWQGGGGGGGGDDGAAYTLPLAGRTLGVVGLGKLGAGMARVAALAFGMEVLAWSANLTQEMADAAAAGAGLAPGAFRVVGREELFRRADVVSLHYVLSARSRGLVGARELGWMKRSAVLVNTARAGLIEEGALIEALTRGAIAGFSTDVFWEEPLPADSVWRRADEWAPRGAVVLSPHMGYVTQAAMERWYQEQAEIVGRWLRGEEVLNRLN